MAFVLLGISLSPTYGTPWRFRRVRNTPRPTRASTRKPVWGFTPRPTRSAPSISEKRCFRIVDKLPHYVKGFNRRRPLCVRLNESQLLQMLKNVGGWNPRYVATSREEACKFTDLSIDAKPLPRNASGDVKGPQGRQKRMVSLRSGSTLRGCWSRGSVVDGSPLRRLCTECAATTQLPSNVFPPIINEVICGDNDHFCYHRIGLCAQKVIKFTFLRRTGEFERNDDLSSILSQEVYVEKVETFQQDIRSCCECRVSPFFGRGR